MATMNLVIRFLAELGGIAALAYAGFQVATPLRAITGIGAALAFIVVWWLIVAPNTANGLSQPQKDLIGTALLLVAAGALAIAGQPRAGHRLRGRRHRQCRNAVGLRHRRTRAPGRDGPMKLAPSLHRIGNDIVACYLVEADDGLTLIDSGVSGQWSDLQAELKSPLGGR